MKFSGLHVCMYTSAGPVTRTINPSPPSIVDFQLPAFLTS